MLVVFTPFLCGGHKIKTAVMIGSSFNQVFDVNNFVK